MPTREEMRAALNIAPPTADEDFDLGLEMYPPKIVGGVIIPSRPMRTVRNLDRILRGDPMFAGAIRWNELAQAVEWSGQLIQDYLVSELRIAIAERHDVEFPVRELNDIIELIARGNSYHPVREYLETLTWDGTPRLSSWLSQWLGVDDTELAREYARKFFVGAVARAYKPGCKMQTALVLHGLQGAYKSTFVETIARQPSWSSTTQIDWDSKDRYQQIQGKWFYELGELSGMGKADMNTIKNFLSSDKDSFRPSYGRHNVERLRQCVFIGTTNDVDCLADPTGDRRFWVVTANRIDIDRVRAEIDAVWAEAVVAYKAGEAWHLSREHDAMRASANEAYRREDPLMNALARYSHGRSWFTAQDFWTHLDYPLPQLTQSVLTRIGQVMAIIDTHDRKQIRVGAAQVRGFRLRGHVDASPVTPHYGEGVTRGVTW
jgi:putative DNA primase/helicase